MSARHKPEYSDIAREMMMRGATMWDLAKKFKVSRSTIYEWIATLQEFSDTIDCR